MESVSICRDSATPCSVIRNNVTRTVSHRRSLSLLPSGLADYSSKCSLYVNRNDCLKLACRNGGAYKVRSNGRRGRIVSAKGGDDGGPPPQYRFVSYSCSVYLMYDHPARDFVPCLWSYCSIGALLISRFEHLFAKSSDNMLRQKPADLLHSFQFNCQF